MAYQHHPAMRKQPRELCQLVRDYAGKLPDPGGAIWEPKHDGIRALWIDGELRTRNGDIIHGADHIRDALAAIDRKLCRPTFIDGEFVVDGNFDATLDHFAARGRAGDQGVLHVFDMLDMGTWRGDAVCPTLTARRRRIDDVIGGRGDDAVRPIVWGWAADTADAERIARDVIGDGGEGIILKAPSAVYARERASSWIRIKRSELIRGRVIGAIPRRGNTDMLGALIVDVDGVQWTVAAGFSNDQRESLWRMPPIGRTAFIKIMQRTASGQARQARYVACE